MREKKRKRKKIISMLILKMGTIVEAIILVARCFPTFPKYSDSREFRYPYMFER